MSTLAEIENALQQLPPNQWQEIRLWMDRNPPKRAARNLPSPPDLPKEELRRIHTLIEAEFSKVACIPEIRRQLAARLSA